MTIEAVLLGMVTAASVVASLFFLRFWRDTRDRFFLAFASFFLAEAVIRIIQLFSEHPNDRSPDVYSIRLFALLAILIAILRKNYGAGARP